MSDFLARDGDDLRPRVVVTRARDQAESLIRGFEAAGARVELLPLIEVGDPRETGPLDEALAHLDTFSWVVFASTNAVDAVVRRRPPPWPEDLRVAAVGPATRAALADVGVRCDLVARERTGEGLARELADTVGPGSGPTSERVLLPRAADGRHELPNGLREAGFDVVAVEAYRKLRPVAARAAAHRLFEKEVGWVTATSPRIARELAALFGPTWPDRRSELRALSIGPTTTRALREIGCTEIHEAEVPGVEGLVRAWREARERAADLSRATPRR